MPGQLLQVHDFSESSLRISCVAEGVKALFQGDNLPRPLVYSFPDDSICLHT